MLLTIGISVVVGWKIVLVAKPPVLRNFVLKNNNYNSK